MNNWYVLTGAPCSGKTTIIKLLEKKGFSVIHEIARVYIDEKMKNGETIEQIRQDEQFFQEQILKMKIDIEKELPKEKTVFFDRGIPDTEAFNRLYNTQNSRLLNSAIESCGYKKVFLLDFLDLDQDYARIETREDQKKLHNFLEKSYKQLNFPLIKVPKLSITKRLKFILNNF